MSKFAIILSSLLVLNLASCVTKPTPGGHPGVAMLYTEPAEPIKWSNVPVWVIQKKIDGKKINGREAKLTETGGLELTPG